MVGCPSGAEGISERSRHVCACLCVSSTSTFCDCRFERMAWDIYGLELYWFEDENCSLLKWKCRVLGYLQNWEMGASIWAEAPPLEFSFWTWVGGTGLWDWPVARYMAWTHRMRSCSSSLANITVSPSFTALKKALPPSKPETRRFQTTRCQYLTKTAWALGKHVKEGLSNLTFRKCQHHMWLYRNDDVKCFLCQKTLLLSLTTVESIIIVK